MCKVKCCYCGLPIIPKSSAEYWEDCEPTDRHYGKPIHHDCAIEWRIEIRIEDYPNATDVGAYLPSKKEQLEDLNDVQL